MLRAIFHEFYPCSSLDGDEVSCRDLLLEIVLADQAEESFLHVLEGGRIHGRVIIVVIKHVCRFAKSSLLDVFLCDQSND